MNKWKVRLDGDEFELEELPKNFNTSDLTVIKEDGLYYLISDDFNSENDQSIILNKADEMVKEINATFKLINPSYNLVKIGHVIEQSENGGKIFTVTLNESISIRDKVAISITDIDGVAKEYFPYLKGSEIVEAASKDNNIKTALSIISENGLTWDVLYKIIELAQIDNSDIMLEEGWITKTQKTLLKRTANSPDALGEQSRHMAQRVDPPDNPMSIDEATKLVKSLLKHWIQNVNDT